MDIDPGEIGWHDDDDMGDAYGEGFEEGMDESGDEEQSELNPDDGSEFGPADLGVAAGFGYHMAQDEIEERKIAEDILKKRDKNQGKPVAVPLWKRNEVKKKGKTTPFGRWATKVNQDPANADKVEMTYTKEEQLQMIRAEGEGHD